MLAYNYHTYNLQPSNSLSLDGSGSCRFRGSSVRSQPSDDKWATVGSWGVFMGLGIAAMHYTGMAAMQLEATSLYKPKSGGALNHLRDWCIFDPLAAVYTHSRHKWVCVEDLQCNRYGKRNCRNPLYRHDSGQLPTDKPIGITAIYPMDNSLLGVGIGIATIVILILVLLTSLFDQRINVETASEAIRQSEERFRS